MFRPLSKVALLAVACTFATTRDAHAQEFPGLGVGNLAAWNMAQDQQFFNSYYRMSGQYGPMRGEYVTPTAPSAPPVKWHLNVLECAVDLPYWHWRQAVPSELRAVAEQGKPGLVSYFRPAAPATPTTPQPTSYGYYNYDFHGPYDYNYYYSWYDSQSGRWYWQPYPTGYYPPTWYGPNYDSGWNPRYYGNFYDHQYSR